MANLINIINKNNFSDIYVRDYDTRFQILTDNKTYKSGAKINEVEMFFLEKSNGIIPIEEIKKDYILQRILPNCEKKYWRLSDDELEVIEMSIDEKTEVDKTILYNSKKAQFENKNFRVTVLTDINAEIKPGFLYFKYMYNDIYTYITSISNTKVSTDIDPETQNGYAFLNEFVSSALTDAIKSDTSNRIKIEYVETYNPENKIWYNIDYQNSEEWLNL